MHADPIIVDARGLVCPHVAIKAKKVLVQLPSDATIKVLCTDPLAALDLPFLATGLGRSYSVGADVGDHFEVKIGPRFIDEPLGDCWPFLSPS